MARMTREEAERWDADARRYINGRQKLIQQREELRKLLGDTDLALEAVRAKGGQPAAALSFLTAQKRMLELSLRQLEGHHLDPQPPAVDSTSPTYEARGLDLQLATLQVDAESMRVLAFVVDAAMPHMRSQEDPPLASPEYFHEEYQEASRTPARLELWDKFLSSFANFDVQLKNVVATRATFQPAKTPGPELLEQFKALNIPALKGEAYRVHGQLRQMPRGEALLKAARDGLMAQLPPPSRRPRPAGKGQNAITNRLRDMFGGQPPAK